MGATGWHYTTQYHPDAEVALQQLRDETFASGDYLPPGGIMRFPSGSALPRGAPLKFRLLMFGLRAIASLSAVAHWFARGCRSPRSIDELLHMAGESGTHSILDVTHTAEIPEFGAATPLSKRRMLKFFGTTTPTRAQLDAIFARTVEDVGKDIERWQAVYFVVHDETGAPIEYVFVGASGD